MRVKVHRSFSREPFYFFAREQDAGYGVVFPFLTELFVLSAPGKFFDAFPERRLSGM